MEFTTQIAYQVSSLLYLLLCCSKLKIFREIWLDIYIALYIVIQSNCGKILCSERLFKGITLAALKELSMDYFSETRSLAVMSLIAEDHGEHVLVTESLIIRC